MEFDNERPSLDSEAKRRKLRKGTRSCWECKRRKVRCTFASETDAVCITCRGRGIKCVGQEHPEEVRLAEKGDGADRMMRVEALLDRLVKTVDHSTEKDESPSTSDHYESHPQLSLRTDSLERPPRIGGDAGRHHSTPIFRTPESQNTPISTKYATSDKHEKISRALLVAFPSQKDMDDILKASKGIPLFCHKSNIKSRRQLDGEDPQDDALLAEIPSSRTHPILIAKQMLTLSSLLVHFPPYEQGQRILKQPYIIRERLADTAIRLVTTCEELLGTMEALECILLEGFYHTNCGNIRRAWLAFRRAMGVAQLMGIHRLGGPPVETINSSTIVDPHFIWFRILYMDRFLSLMLALPQGSYDGSIECDNSVAIGESGNQIERFHVGIMARILERNQFGRSPHALALTKDIDAELLKIAAIVPKKLWRPPNFAGLQEESMERFEESMRVKDQMFHYTLLNQLHLPYLFCPSAQRKNEYARITCMNASREILTSFIAFRIYNPVPACCRMADFLALVAGMTLIFAHLHSYCDKEKDNILAHQRLRDRATVEQALENMEGVSKLNEDMLAARCAKLLLHLLHIEDDAARGQKYSAERVQLNDGYHEDNHNALLIAVPYFGTIRIAHEGISSKHAPQRQSQHVQEFGRPITVGGIGSVRVANSILTQDSDHSSGIGIDPTSRDNHTTHPNRIYLSHSQRVQPHTEILHDVLDTNQLPSALIEDDFLQQQDLYPGLAAGMNDWVFQGVDTAFFDNLMKGVNGQPGDGGENADWGRSWDGDLGGT